MLTLKFNRTISIAQTLASTISNVGLSALDSVRNGTPGMRRNASVSMQVAQPTAAMPATAQDTQPIPATPATGLTAAQAEQLLTIHGRNEIAGAPQPSLVRRAITSLSSPFSAILLVLGAISLYTNVIAAAPAERDPWTPGIIFAMCLVACALDLVQEGKGRSSAEGLKHMAGTRCTVARDGHEQQLDPALLVPGDLVRLAAGSLVPADLVLTQSNNLLVNEAALTGESEPVERGASGRDIVRSGTAVQSGTATGIVIATGNDTQLGQLAATLDADEHETSFDAGVASVSRTLVRLMAVMAPVVLLLNGATKGDWLGALLFAASVAVGITPQMLPVIVTTCLSRGAAVMAKRGVIVKELPAIQNLGAMDVLCCDKTGTLTEDRVRVMGAVDARGESCPRTLELAALNSWHQSGIASPIDEAILEEAGVPTATGSKLAELPFDFERRCLSVAVTDAGADDGAAVRPARLITKGAVAEVLARCTQVELGGNARPLDATRRTDIAQLAASLNARGQRVIAVAHRQLDQQADARSKLVLTPADEQGLTLVGLVALADTPKASAAEALARLRQRGVVAKVLTGDAPQVAAAICAQVGLDASLVLTGANIDRLSDEQLARKAERVQLFSALTPLQKARLVRVLREQGGHTVGFMGDGINDAAAMRASDCGVSVDTACDVAKDAADVILGEKDLGVLEQAVVEGRRTYGNLIKYLKLTASSNFGNVFSVLAASAALPFLPMTALQLVVLALIYELACVALPWDRVDEEYLERPRTWQTDDLTQFMAWMGPVSSLFDLATFALMFFVVCPAVAGGSWSSLATTGDAAAMARFVATFQTGWFVESMWTQTLVIHALRSPKLPFVGSRASLPVCLATGIGTLVATVLPFTPAAHALGLTALPAGYFVALAALVAGYLALVTLAKRLYLRRHAELV